MKVSFYYVRHGETLFNRSGRMQGMCDSPLTEKGIQGAYDIASVLRQVHFDHAFTSSSERAWKTCEIICQYHSVEPVCMKGLKEFDFGDLDGEEIEKFKDQVWGSGMKDDWTEYHGESMELFDQRTRKAFDDILRQCSDNDNVLIVSHGSFIMHLMKTLLNFDQQAYVDKRNKEGRAWMPNCGICVFCYEDGRWYMKEEPVSAEEFRNIHFPKTVKYYLVRHGETLFNVQNRLQGQCDSPLTEKGIAQVKETGNALKDVSFNRVYSSTSERGRDTAEILLEGRNMSYTTDDRLKEINFGILEGSKFFEDWDTQEKRFYDVHYSDIGGEDIDDVKERVRTFLRDSYDEADDQDAILLVTHANYYTVLLEEMFDINRVQLFQEARKQGVNPTPNGGVCIFTCTNGTWKLEKRM